NFLNCTELRGAYKNVGVVSSSHASLAVSLRLDFLDLFLTVAQALGLGVVGEDYAWVLQGAPEDAWWASADFSCEAGSLGDAVEGLLLVSSYGRSPGDTPSDSGLTYDEFVGAVGREAQPVSELAAQTFDAVWALGLALRNAQRVWSTSLRSPRLHDFNYHRNEMAREFLRQIALLNFTGVSGPVSFRQADRIGTSLISQVQGGVARPVALFHPARGALQWLGGDGGGPAVRWAGGHTPVSRRVCVLRVITVSSNAFLAITCLAALGMLVAVLFLAFNLHYRRLKYIKLSSPRLNNMAAVGCVLVYAAVILLGIDHATLPNGAPFSAVCTARVYLLSAGFSLAFGSMFTKTYRVHRIFTMSYGCYSGSKKKLLQDTQLMSLVGALLLLDVMVVTLWAAVDPMHRHLHNLTLEISPSDRGVVYQTQVEICKSQYTESWLGALYVYKGLLLVVGLYMAWETRRVKIPALNDSHYIGLSVYFVVVCSGLSVVLASLLWQRVTLAYVCSTALVWASTTATLCLLFLPKLHALQTGTADPVGQSMGLRLQYNTRRKETCGQPCGLDLSSREENADGAHLMKAKYIVACSLSLSQKTADMETLALPCRFVVDEGQEQRYRVQVQNKVYRRELAALQAEAARLELQLESPSVAVSSASVSLEDSSVSVRDEVYAARMHAAHPLAPLLLLAVLPPVTPRASWPSAAPERPRAASTQQVNKTLIMKSRGETARKLLVVSSLPELQCVLDTKFSCIILCVLMHKNSSSVGDPLPCGAVPQQTFQSEPQLEPALASDRPGPDHHYMRRETFAGTGTPVTGKQGMLGRFLNLFSARHTGLDNRGNSTGSITGITSALRAHMGYIAGLVPSGAGTSRRNDSEASSPGSTRGRVVVPPHIAVLAADEDTKRKFSLAAMCVLSQSNSNASEDEDDEDADDGVGGGAGGGSAGRLRVRGSPRFPHRVVPVQDQQASGSSRLLSAAPSHYLRGGGVARGPRGGGGAGGGGAELAGARCRSLEDARGMRRSSLGSSLSGHGANGLGANYPFRAISLSPNCDVWAIKERGIPFTDFAIREKFLRAQREQLEEKLLRHQQQQQQQQKKDEDEAEEEVRGECRGRGEDETGSGSSAAVASGPGPGPGPADCSDGCVDQSPSCQSEGTSHERTQD
ncbi:Gamma-aminobutyric acid type B receptor subunit 2, partial [Frankliniella fusca]